MDEDTLLEEGLYDRPQSPPPPPPHPPPEGQVQAPEDPFAGLFPALRVPDRPVLPESVHEYVDKFMDREAFESQFTDFPTVFAPPRLDPNFKLGPFAKELERLTLSSTDRAGHALAPLCHLMGAVQDPDLRNAIALATLAVGQAIAQLSYVRRLNALRELWGSTHLDSARSVIKEASGSFPRDVLFGENFTDLCKKQGGTPPAPKPPVQSYNKAPARGGAYQRQAPTRNRNFYRPYDRPDQGYHARGSSATRGKSSFRSAGETGAGENGGNFFRLGPSNRGFRRKMGRVNHRPGNFVLGGGDYFGFFTTPSLSAQGGKLPFEGLPPEGQGLDTHRAVQNRGDQGNGQPQVSSGVIHQGQAGPGPQVDSRSIPAQQAVEHDPFQNGRVTAGSNAIRTRGLYVEDRPGPGLLQCPDSGTQSAFPSVPMARSNIHVHPHVFRVMHGTPNIYQTFQTSSEAPQREGREGYSISGRYLASARLQGNVREVDKVPSGPATPAGVQRECQQKFQGGTVARVPGDELMFPHNVGNHSRTEADTDRQSVASHPQRRNMLDSLHGEPAREAGSSASSVPNGTVILSNTPELVHTPLSGGAVVNSPSAIIETTAAGTGVLGATAPYHSPSANNQISGIHYKGNDRRIPHGVGSDPKRSADSGIVDPARVRPAHQCVGAPGDRASANQLSGSPTEQDGAPSRRQHHQPLVHNEERGNQKPGVDQDSSQNLGVCPQREHQSRSSAHTGDRQRAGGLHVPLGPDGDHRMEATPSEVQSLEQTLGTIQEGSVCKPRDNTVTRLHIVEDATPAHECVSLQVDTRGLCFPTVRDGGSSSAKGPSGSVQDSASSPMLEGSVLVHSTASHAVRQSEKPRVQVRPDKGPGKQPAPAKKKPTFDGVSCYRNRLREQGFPENVVQLITEANSEGTLRQYQSAWGKWAHFCDSRNLDANPNSPNIENIAAFLTSKYEEGIQYNQLNKYRSALSSFMPKLDGNTVGQHPTIEKLLKAFYKKVPPRPRYSTTWNIDSVLQYWKARPDEGLTLYHLGIKTLTLLSVATMGRTADIRNMSADNYKVERDGNEKPIYLELLLINLPKQQRSGPLLPVRIYASAEEGSENICPVNTCLSYIQRTLPLRVEGVKELLLRSTKPYTAVKPKTATNWILFSMRKAGIDTTTYKAHSICSASASGSGKSIKEIMAVGRWTKESTLKRFYLRNVT